MGPLSLTFPKALGTAYERHGRWLPELAKLLLVIVLARLLAELVWLCVPAGEQAAWHAAPVAAAPSRSGAAAGPNIEGIAAAHLFGEYRAPASPALAEMSRAPDTQLSLSLLGILAADRDGESRALIGTQDGEEKPYSVGDDVVRGVNLQAIFTDRVILARNGQLETLRLDKSASGAPLPGTMLAPQATENAQSVTPETAQMLGQIRQQLLADPGKASEYIRVQPANVGGSQRGYRIYPGRDRSIFSNAGLKPGDLVTSVNGVDLSDPSRALQMLGDLSQAGTINVTIERGGVQQAITVNLN